MHLIGLVGRAGAGKDTVAGIIGRRLRAPTFAFADRLRAEVAEAYAVDPRLFVDRDSKERPAAELAIGRCNEAEFRWRHSELSYDAPLSPRWVMQHWGDMMRERDREHYVWPAVIARAAAINSAADALIVTDVRFPNEADWIDRNGGLLWRIVRDQVDSSAAEHVSETGSASIAVDQVIRNDGTLEELERVVVDLVGQLEEARDAA
ncbi:MAG: hypothetical protein RIS35_2952 [Pseudomonadota bacterium]|jgi:hypothetical protein